MENEPLVNDLLSNRSGDALLRDAELELVKHKIPPVDLRTVPLDKHIGHDVTIPPLVKSFLDRAFASAPLSEEEVHALEEAVEQYHGVKPPYYIAMSITLQQTGRPWAHVPEAGQYLTGFTLGKE